MLRLEVSLFEVSEDICVSSLQPVTASLSELTFRVVLEPVLISGFGGMIILGLNFVTGLRLETRLMLAGGG